MSRNPSNIQNPSHSRNPAPASTAASSTHRRSPEASNYPFRVPKALRVAFAMAMTSLALYVSLPVQAQQDPVPELLSWQDSNALAQTSNAQSLHSLDELKHADTNRETQSWQTQETQVKDRKSSSKRKGKRHLQGALNIHKATLKEWILLPGIGDKKAQRILESRDDSPFAGIEDLKRVKGIGKKWLESNREYLREDGDTTLTQSQTK